MATAKGVLSVGDFLSSVTDAKSRLGLDDVPATPWYLGQSDFKGNLLPAFFKSGIEPDLERETLRDYRQASAEFASVRNVTDGEILIAAHMSGLPTRILDWSGNPLLALFLSAETLSAEAGRVWVLNPWAMNELTANLFFVPPVESDYFTKYVVKLGDMDAPLRPEASHPLAFRPTRTIRNYNTQNIYWTVHGKNAAALNELTFFMKRADTFLTIIQVAAEGKKAIMRELHDLGVTRSNLFPSPASLARTIAYRYSNNYIKV